MTHTAKRYDLKNGVSFASGSVHASTNVLKDYVPYSRDYDENGVSTIFFNFHFLKELRRQLSGTTTESYFSPIEQSFYDDWNEWTSGAEKSGELAKALEALDQWLLNEVTGVENPLVSRIYEKSHKWRRIMEGND